MNRRPLPGTGATSGAAPARAAMSAACVATPIPAKAIPRPLGGPPEVSLASSRGGLLAISTGPSLVAAAAVVAAGIAFLLLRPALAALPHGGVALLAAGYLLLGALAACLPLPAPRAAAPARAGALPAMPALPVLAAGVAAVALAARIVGLAPALPGGAAPSALALDLLAAGAEEALFRRLLFGWLERWSVWGTAVGKSRPASGDPGAPGIRRAGLAVAVVGSATVFALVHLPLYGLAALPVDFGAGLLFSWQRAATGRWAVPAATHAAANLMAVIIR